MHACRTCRKSAELEDCSGLLLASLQDCSKDEQGYLSHNRMGIDVSVYCWQSFMH